MNLVFRHHRMAVIVLACVTALLSSWWGATVGGGADSYGYMSQADAWLGGHLRQRQDVAPTLPWPHAAWSLTTLGYRLAPDGESSVPIYPPGLPFLMAAAKAVAGQPGLFQVVPVCAGLLVFATYAIGRALGRPLAGAAAAWLVATSPTVLFAMMWPMSDVPAAACWALAWALALADTRRAAAAAGLAAATAILIRPNLAPAAAALVLLLAWRDLRVRPWRTIAGLRTPWFAVFVIAGAGFIARLNAYLYGSPVESGHGGFSYLYDWANVPVNLRQYATWLGTYEPAMVVGVAALVLGVRRLWRPAAVQAQWFFTLFAAIVCVSYLIYAPFDAWWYLRFLLPAFPLMALGAAVLLGALGPAHRRWRRLAAVLALVVVGWVNVAWAREHGIFELADAEAKYPEVASLVRRLTPRDAVIVTLQHSGTIRYYGGRWTVRWDYLEPDWLDRAVAWLDANGHPPYVLIERSELPMWTERFGSASAVGRLDWIPVADFRHGDVRLYEAANRGAPDTIVSVVDVNRQPRYPTSVPLPPFRQDR